MSHDIIVTFISIHDRFILISFRQNHSLIWDPKLQWIFAKKKSQNILIIYNHQLAWQLMIQEIREAHLKIKLIKIRIIRNKEGTRRQIKFSIFTKWVNMPERTFLTIFHILSPKFIIVDLILLKLSTSSTWLLPSFFYSFSGCNVSPPHLTSCIMDEYTVHYTLLCIRENETELKSLEAFHCLPF